MSCESDKEALLHLMWSAKSKKLLMSQLFLSRNSSLLTIISATFLNRIQTAAGLDPEMYWGRYIPGIVNNS